MNSLKEAGWIVGLGLWVTPLLAADPFACARTGRASEALYTGDSSVRPPFLA